MNENTKTIVRHELLDGRAPSSIEDWAPYGVRVREAEIWRMVGTRGWWYKLAKKNQRELNGALRRTLAMLKP